MDICTPARRNPDGSLQVSERTKERAIAWIEGLQASMDRSYAEKLKLLGFNQRLAIKTLLVEKQRLGVN